MRYGLTITLVALALRCWRLTWGLDDGSWFPDETIWQRVCSTFVPLSGASFFTIPAAFAYPTLYGIVTGIAGAMIAAAGVAISPLRLLVLARGVSVAADIVTMWCVWRLGTRLAGASVGRRAAAFQAVLPLAVMQVHYASVDALLVCGIAGTMLAAERLAAGATWRWAAWAGGLAGPAFATKFTGLVAVVIVGWAVLEAAWPQRSPATACRLGAAAALGFVVAFACCCPPCITQSALMLEAWRRLDADAQTGVIFANNHVVPSLGWYGHRYVYQLVAACPYVFGWPLYALAVVGGVVAAGRGGRSFRLLGVAIVAYFVAIGRSGLAFPRYLLVLGPALVVLAAIAVETFRGRWRVAVGVGVWVYTAVLAASQVHRFSLGQQEAVVRWLTAHFGAHVRDVRVAGPADPFDYYHLARRVRAAGMTYQDVADGGWGDLVADAVVVPEWYEIMMRRDRPESPEAHDFARTLAPGGGLREVVRWRSWFLQRDFYTRLDPAFAGDLWQGEIGFAIWVRDGREAGGEPH